MKQEIIKKRLKAIRQYLRGKNVGSLIITNPTNVTYLTGFLGDDSWAMLTAKNIFLLTDSRYTEQAYKQCFCCKILERKESMHKATVKLLDSIKTVKAAGIEKYTSLSDYNMLNKHSPIQIKQLGGIVESVRIIKDDYEIKVVKAAVKIASAAFRHMLGYVKYGVTENELAGKLDFEIRKLGANNSFPTIVAFSSNSSCPHHQPTNKKLKRIDTVLIDFGVRYKGYCCDLTRCFAVGNAGSAYRKAYDVVLKAQTAAINNIKAGASVTTIDSAAREVISEEGFGVYGHGTGHGIGLQVHEQPIIAQKIKGKLRAGMVFTIEPAIYIPSKMGIRIEDDILVTKNGCEVLSSKLPKLPSNKLADFKYGFN